MLIIGIVALLVAVQIIRSRYVEEERAARIKLRQAVMDHYPEATDALKTAYGLKALKPSTEQAPIRIPESPVVMVHGLDDPGKVWMNLAPALEAQGHAVWILTYPNDQPVAESSRFFLAQLQESALSKADHLTIVAHSMGGLVTREMLSAPALGYAEAVQSGRLPRIKLLIMVATPNHGSELARFRGFTEIRDQIGSILKGDYHWLRGIVDGAGEAGVDLLPDSEFLRTLNARPYPAGVRMRIIAGVMSPKEKEEILAQARRLEQNLPDAARGAVRKMTENLIAVTDQVGDGLVSVDSARLAGVPLQTVTGTHMSIIRNMTANSRRVPPAVPLIVEQLRESGPARSSQGSGTLRSEN